MKEVVERWDPPRLLWISLLYVGLLLHSGSGTAAYSEAGLDWSYRALIQVPNSAAVGSTVVLDADLAAELATLGSPDPLDSASVRVVKADGSLVAVQEYNDRVYAGVLDAASNGRGEIRFLLEDAPGVQSYFVYWDVGPDGTKPVNPAPPINGTFEQTTGTTPVGWTVSTVNARGGQVNLTRATNLGSSVSVPGGCATGAATADESPFSRAGRATGRFWHLLGYRERCEDGSGNEQIRLSRSIQIPAGAAAGNLSAAVQVQGWDGIQDSSRYDWIEIRVDGARVDHRTLGLGGGLRIERNRFGRSGYSSTYRDFGWQQITLDLAPYAGRTINLRFQTRHSATDNDYRTWLKVDEVEWSRVDATLGPPEDLGSSAARLILRHDANAVFCLAEPVELLVVDAAGAPIANFEGDIDLTTGAGSGSFAVITGAGGLSNLGGGQARYRMTAADNGSATLALTYSSGPTAIDIDAALSTDGGVADDDSEGLLQFAPSGLTVTGSPLPNPPPGGFSLPVPTQIAGTAFPIYLTAFGVTEDDPVCGVIESYEGSRPLRFWTTHVDPVAGSLNAMVDGSPSGTSRADAVTQTVTFTSGQAAVSAAYFDAGAIRLEVDADAGTPGVLEGASNGFVVRPAELVVSAVDSLSGAVNPAATTMAGPAFLTAGTPFRVQVIAVAANGAITPGFGLEAAPENVRVSSAALLAPAGGRNGSTGDVAGGAAFSRTGPGTFSSSGVSFDEVGIIALDPAIADGDYLGTGGVPGRLSDGIGRFYPERFVLTDSTVTAACGDFTYLGQPQLSLSYRIEARNSLGAIVENYDASLISVASLAAVTRVAEDSDNGVDLSARLSTSVPLWARGVLNESTTTVNLARSSGADGPFDQLQLGVQLIDTLDGGTLTGLDMHPATSGDCSAGAGCVAQRIGAPTRARYGRLAVLPGVAPESEALSVPLQAQYFDGVGFRAHREDRCSLYSVASTALGAFTAELNPGETSVTGPAAPTALVDGEATTAAPLQLAAPGLGNAGTVEVTLDVPSWLEFDWRGAGVADPSGLQTFGTYRGSDRVVYWEEVDP